MKAAAQVIIQNPMALAGCPGYIRTLYTSLKHNFILTYINTIYFPAFTAFIEKPILFVHTTKIALRTLRLQRRLIL